MNTLNYLSTRAIQPFSGRHGSPLPSLIKSGTRRDSRPYLRNKGKRGFTLMEMIIVLGIIALLMGLVIANLSPIQGVAQEKRARADILSLREALSAYQLQTGTLPTTEQGIKALWQKPTTDPIPDQWRKVMDDEVQDPWNHPYNYQNPGKHNPDGYDLWSNGSGDGRILGNWKNTGTETSQ